MKKIIEGKRYNTKTAIKVGSHAHGWYPGSGDFSHWSATLYRTPKSGRYFLHGEGGAMTRFAEYHADGSRSGGEKIIPLTREDALAWAEQFLDPDEIESAFADLIEDA